MRSIEQFVVSNYRSSIPYIIVLKRDEWNIKFMKPNTNELG